MSDALHAMPEGDVVGLAAPFGTFAIKEKSAVLVLISAGIGVTPMKSFLSSHPDQIAFALHVDRNEESHAFKEEFANAVASKFIYTQDVGRPSPEALVEHLQSYLKDCDFFICGPTPFLTSTTAALTAAGATVYRDIFGADLARDKDQPNYLV